VSAQLEFDVVVSRASSDQDVRGGHRDTGRACASREIKGGIPNCAVDAKFRQQSLEIPEHLPVTIAPCAVP
jgi:hypothetical protein